MQIHLKFPELQEGDAVSFSSIGSIQGAIVQGTTYFVANVINKILLIASLDLT